MATNNNIKSNKSLSSNINLNANNNGENQYFYEDEVYSIDKRGKVKFGLVMENYEAAPSDDEFEDSLKKGEIRVAWHPEGNEEVLNENRVGLADRTLMPGDVVRRMIPGKDTQRGYCHEIHVKADLKILGTKYVMKNVSSERLKSLVNIPRDHAVCLDSWVGSTKDYNQKLVLKTSCESVLELVVDIEYCPLRDTESKTRCGLFAASGFYPGQSLIGPVSELENAKWLTTSPEMRSSRKHKTVDRRFVVQSVEMEGVWVNWQCKASGENIIGENNEDLSLQQPKSFISGEDLKRLKRLNLFESCMLQINDKGYIKILESDLLVRKSHWKREQSTKYRFFKNQDRHVVSNTSKNTISIFNNNNMNKNNAIQRDINTIKTTITATTELDDIENAKNYNLNLKQLECDKTKLCPNTINTICNLNNDNERSNETAMDEDNEKSIQNPKTSNTSNLSINDYNAIKENNLSNTSLSNKSTSTNNKTREDEWQTDEDGIDDENNGSTSDCSTTISSSCSSTATPKGSPKKSSPLLANKIRGRIRKRNVKPFISMVPEKVPKVDDEVVAETLVIYSLATVVWQDGTIEYNIPSTELYPIHHLDDHEFFPGDYVLAGSNNDKKNNLSYREYGVIQNVDHQGRTALVKWFSTYTCNAEPVPTYKGETEVSVYDLKDHPDFQYCPGTIVIRVANFVGADVNCTAGQVIDNYPEGRVKVWWVDDHISMCWPQDLFEVGQYDSDNNFWSNADSDNDSWVTEDETSELGDNTTTVSHTVLKNHLTTNLERARVAMSRLEEMFIVNPNLQNHDIMRKLLLVYKKCRYLDRLMNTQFFHEDNFMGLIERVRKSEQQSTAERVLDQKHRLFHGSGTASCQSSSPIISVDGNVSDQTIGVSDPSQLMNSSPNPLFKKPKLLNLTLMGTDEAKYTSMRSPIKKCCVKMSQQLQQQQQQQQMTDVSKLLTSACSDNNDSGNFSAISTSSSPSSTAMLTATTTTTNSNNTTKQAELEAELNNVKNLMSLNKTLEALKATNNTNFNFTSFLSTTDSIPSECVSAKLCSLIKVQLHKALNEITERYAPLDLFKEIVLDNNSDNETNPSDSIQTETDGDNIIAVDSLLLLREKLIPEEKTSLECFHILETAPVTHKYHLTVFHATNTQHFYRAVQKEHKLLRNSLPPGVWVRTFEDRLDLLSFLIEGPKNTPYENGLFMFDLQLGQDYPRTPPLCHYISYCSDRLNPNLYEDGKVCVSLLGTWSGRGTEIWGSTSTLLQLIVSIQGLILVDEPYFNEAGYEKQRGTQQGKENSRMYNEMVVLKLIQSMTKLINLPSSIFHDHILKHFAEYGEAMHTRIKGWLDISNEYMEKDGKIEKSNLVPEFPLVPASRGFCLSLSGLLENFHKALQSISSE